MKPGKSDTARRHLGRPRHAEHDRPRQAGAVRRDTQADSVPVSGGGATVPTGDRCRGSEFVIDLGPINLPGRHVYCNALTADCGTIIDTLGTASPTIDTIIDAYGALCVDGGATLDLTAPGADGGLAQAGSGTLELAGEVMGAVQVDFEATRAEIRNARQAVLFNGVHNHLQVR
jgi:hypothetical protein